MDQNRPVCSHGLADSRENGAGPPRPAVSGPGLQKGAKAGSRKKKMQMGHADFLGQAGWAIKSSYFFLWADQIGQSPFLPRKYTMPLKFYTNSPYLRIYIRWLVFKCINISLDLKIFSVCVLYCTVL